MATNDIVTLTEAKAELGGSVVKTFDDDGIQSAITALSAMFDDRFGAAVKRTITAEPITLPYSRFPLGAVADVACWTDYYPIVGTPTLDTGTVTVADRQFGRVQLTTSAATTITYDAGRFDDTASVSDQFKQAMFVALRNWRQQAHTAPFVPPGPDYPTPRTPFPTFAIPNAATQMLSKYIRHEGLA